jgi:hypothetical protein
MSLLYFHELNEYIIIIITIIIKLLNILCLYLCTKYTLSCISMVSNQAFYLFRSIMNKYAFIYWYDYLCIKCALHINHMQQQQIIDYARFMCDASWIPCLFFPILI